MIVLVAAMVSIGIVPGVAGASMSRQATTVAAAQQVKAAVATKRLITLVRLANWATTQKIPYVYAGGHGARPSLTGGVDCSGLVRWLYSQAFGVDIGSGSGDSMVRLSGLFVRTSTPVPGDVVMFGNRGAAPAYHSGIYIGLDTTHHPVMVNNSSPGTFVHINGWWNRSWAGDFMGYWHLKAATAADSAGTPVPVPVPVPAPLNVQGAFDVAAPALGGITVTGWSYDPKSAAVSNAIRVTLDGRVAVTAPAALARADVNAAHRVTGRHGYSTAVPATPGTHRICVTGLALTGSTSVANAFGCVTRIVPLAASGHLEKATGGRKLFSVSGWAIDRNRPTLSNTVQLTLDGHAVKVTPAALQRLDFTPTLRIGPFHGFAAAWPAGPGSHVVCVISQPAGVNTVAGSLGCRTVTVTA